MWDTFIVQSQYHSTTATTTTQPPLPYPPPILYSSQSHCVGSPTANSVIGTQVWAGSTIQDYSRSHRYAKKGCDDSWSVMVSDNDVPSNIIPPPKELDMSLFNHQLGIWYKFEHPTIITSVPSLQSSWCQIKDLKKKKLRFFHLLAIIFDVVEYFMDNIGSPPTQMCIN